MTLKSSIDKTNSTELSEAINSMYKWYKRARVCYAYLADVPNTMGLSIRGKIGLSTRSGFFEGVTSLVEAGLSKN